MNDEENNISQVFLDYLLQEANPCMRIVVKKKNKNIEKLNLNATDLNSNDRITISNTTNILNGVSNGILSEDDNDEHDNKIAKSILNNTLTKRTFTVNSRNDFSNKKAIVSNSNNNTSNNNNISNNTDNLRSAKEDLELRRQLKAHMKDQLETLKIQTVNKTKYAKELIETILLSEQRTNQGKEKKAASLAKNYNNMIEDENRVNAEVESFLRGSIKRSEELLLRVNQDYERDLKEREKEYEELKVKKNIQQQNITELKRLYYEYEKVVVEYRIEKEKERKEEEIKIEKFNAAVKVQRWWREYAARKKQDKKDKKKVKRSSRRRK